MSDMQWRRADGTTGTYSGPLVELGQGIPRPMRDFGIRRAVYDLAFGYVSGFPLRDIVPFALRSLFPSRVLTATPTCAGCGEPWSPLGICCDELSNEIETVD